MKSLSTIILLSAFGLVTCQWAPPTVTRSVATAVSEDDVTNPYERALLVKLDAGTPEQVPGIENFFRLSANFFSGGEPQGAPAFRQLADRGIRTLLSVDGKAPNAELATSLGMRYVHVPIQYSGITTDEMRKITKTYRELEGPFYVHCFHGKHRGPAAAAIGRVIVDGVSREQALAEMRQWCGTSVKYAGLYGAVALQPFPTEKNTANLDWQFPTRKEFQGLRQIMIESTRIYENLKVLSDRNWEIDPAHPDVDPVNQGKKIVELFEQSLTLHGIPSKPADYLARLDETVQVGEEIVKLTRLIQKGDPDARAAATRAVTRIKSVCNACHKKYRN